LSYYYQYDDETGSNFFDVYYSLTRFAIETTMAVLAMTLNVLDKAKVNAKQPLSLVSDNTNVSAFVVFMYNKRELERNLTIRKR